MPLIVTRFQGLSYRITVYLCYRMASHTLVGGGGGLDLVKGEGG